MSPAPRNAASRRGMNAGQAAALARATDGRRQHKDWLNLVEITGPFLTLPVLVETWPTLDPLEREQRAPLRLQHGLWSDDPSAGRDEWVAYLLHDLLEWDDALHLPIGDADALLDRLALPVPEHDTTLRPDFVLIEPDSDPAHDSGDITKSIPLLGMTIPAGSPPTSRLRDGDGWAATPADRMARLLRHHRIELGLVTDGRWWCLVWAPAGGVTATVQFDTVGWNEAAEREVVRAFISLLRRFRFFSVLDDQTLPQLLRKSLGKQEDVTEALGVQVRQAVELLVDAIGRADTRAVERGEPGLDAQGVQASQVYRGAVAVMMRVVFLLFAEERGLLPADNEVYAKAYSAGGLCAELEARAAMGTTAELEQSTAAWHRLIALFHAVYGGVAHPEFQLHAYDGSIFDPKTYWWLEGLPAPGAREVPAGHTPLLPINDLTVLHMLQAVQHVTIGTGKNAERRTLTFRTLDVEQIGYVYEGLLSYDGRRAEDTVVGLVGKSGLEDEVLLTYLEQLAGPYGIGARAGGPVDVKGLAKRLAEVHKDSGIGSAAALEKKLAPLSEVDKVEAERLLHVVTGDTALVPRLLPFFSLIRRDLRDLPLVIGAGSLYVTDSATRKNTGTHYTPRFLAEKVVKGALQPLVYAPGPLETADEAAWVLRSAEEILSLKVADIAMGSAAFLVAACRYLAEKLIDAWVKEGHEGATAFRAGPLQAGSGMEIDADPVVIEAKRQIIEHCLYGVDINPMAVEMAKLSLWLVSMDPHRPFTFLDDRLVVGDSLLGVTSLDQVEVVHLDAKVGRKLHRDRLWDWTSGVRARVGDVAGERRAITKIKGTDLASLDRKRQLLDTAREHMGQLTLVGDLAAGAALVTAGTSRDAEHEEAALLAEKVASPRTADDAEVVHKARLRAMEWLAKDRPDDGLVREPVHWPLVFPEVFDQGGFDAIVGNPPFLGGQKLTGTLGQAYREYLVLALGRGRRGSADLVAYFALRAHQLLNARGQTGLIATNTLAQGDTREVGLDQLTADGIEIRGAVKSAPWPSKSATLEYCAVWSSAAPVAPEASRVLDDVVVRGITPSLDAKSRVSGKPYRLVSNRGRSFQGSNVLGKGFILTPD
ncbi:hypothetical protein Q5530_37265, partial [Saccharothrix sp. BKS2]|uniref:Eco57I restriction-modification methylase domain-containing protein n=1 Tax=Saccharothrix sp. BKS2 TaxID=3064400 RepID=UPI0039EB7C92